MNWLKRFWHRRKMEQRLDKELRFHLEQHVADLVARGCTVGEAKRQARLALGGSEQVKEQCRDARGTRWLEDVLQDGRHSFRILRQNPIFAAASILSLALGIGANTAIFTVFDSVMLKSLPVQEPNRLVELMRTEDDDTLTYPLWEQIRARQDVFSSVFAYSGASFAMATEGEKHLLHGLYVSGDYFKTLGVHPILGRAITSADDEGRQGSIAAVAVISYGFWRREFGGDSTILGRTIRLDGHRFQVIGVTAPQFFGVDVGETFDVAVPLTSEALFHPDDNQALEGRSHWWLNIIGRLKKDVSPQQASARLKAMAHSVFRDALPTDLKPESQRKFLESSLALRSAATGLSDVRRRYGAGLVLLMGVVGVVLLIACANVANLLLARASARQREIAVRLAIGAARWRLIRQLLTESIVISLLGSAAGTLLAFWTSRLFVSLISSDRDPRFLDLNPDWRVIGFTVTVATLAGLLFGSAPAIQSTRWSFSSALRESAPINGGHRRGWGFGRFLVAAQVALSLVLVVDAGLFAGTVQRLLMQDMGFRRDGVLLIDPDLQTGRFSPERQASIANELLERVRSLPAVKSAARSAVTPISGSAWQWDVRVDSASSSQKSVHCFFNLVSSGFFETLGTPILAGRNFTDRDTKTSPLVAILNEAAARKLFPGKNAIGRTYHDEVSVEHGTKQVIVEVVGIAKDAKYRRLRDEIPPTIYLPMSQNPAPFLVVGTYEVHFAGSSHDVVGEMKKALATIDPELSAEFHLLSSQVADSLVQEKLLATLAGFFGLLALLLASIGLYGVVAYSVSRRRNEIGIRMALGADKAQVMRMVLGEVALVTGGGLAIGLVLAEAGTSFVSSFLYGLAPNDPSTLILATLLLAGVCMFAGYIPARRASSLNPMRTLREE